MASLYFGYWIPSCAILQERNMKQEWIWSLGEAKLWPQPIGYVCLELRSHIWIKKIYTSESRGNWRHKRGLILLGGICRKRGKWRKDRTLGNQHLTEGKRKTIMQRILRFLPLPLPLPTYEFICICAGELLVSWQLPTFLLHCWRFFSGARGTHSGSTAASHSAENLTNSSRKIINFPPSVDKVGGVFHRSHWRQQVPSTQPDRQPFIGLFSCPYFTLPISLFALPGITSQIN